MENLIEIKGVTKWFPVGGVRFVALSDINLSYQKGEFTGIIGPSGSGKTTLLNIIGSLDVPSEGSATVLGKKIESLSQKEAAELRSRFVGFIFQTYNLLPVYTVFENVEFPLLLLNYSEKERKRMVEDALAWVHLTSKMKSRPAQLSGGESQRVAIARAIVKKPELILADEPTANLDSENSNHILTTMEDLNKNFKTTFIFSTHDEKVMKYLRRKVYLVDGKVFRDEKVME
jgi:putative ABC transport system ATP-binding protein